MIQATRKSIVEDRVVPRPLEYWLERHRPGYVSRESAERAQPIQQAEEILALATAFLQWLRMPPAARWESLALQRLSATLFGSFVSRDSEGKVHLVRLLELKWPPGSEEVTRSLREMQTLLAPSFAVYRALRAPLRSEEFPTAAECDLADEALDAQRCALAKVLDELGRALRS